MTVSDLFAAGVRRWFVLMIGLVLTLATVAWVRSVPGVYAAQADLTFLAPASVRYPNPLGISPTSLIATAGLVEREVNHGRPVPASVSAAVTLVDLGIRDGTEVRLPNSGGQWAYNFARPVLDVQAVGPTSGQVRSAMATEISAVRGTLDHLQDAARVDRYNRISIEASPAEVDVIYRAGHPTIAAAMTVLIGLVFSAAAVVVLDRRIRTRRQRYDLAGGTTAVGARARQDRELAGA